MTICTNCGKDIRVVGRSCPYCNAPIIMGNITNKKAIDEQDNVYDCKDNKLLMLSMICFPYGLYFYFSNKNEYPMRSSSALGGAFVGILAVAIIITLVMVSNMMK